MQIDWVRGLGLQVVGDVASVMTSGRSGGV